MRLLRAHLRARVCVCVCVLYCVRRYELTPNLYVCVCVCVNGSLSVRPACLSTNCNFLLPRLQSKDSCSFVYFIWYDSGRTVHMPSRICFVALSFVLSISPQLSALPCILRAADPPGLQLRDSEHWKSQRVHLFRRWIQAASETTKGSCRLSWCWGGIISKLEFRRRLLRPGCHGVVVCVVPKT